MSGLGGGVSFFWIIPFFSVLSSDLRLYREELKSGFAGK